MARISTCMTCGATVCDANYCSEECAVAPLSDLLCRIRQKIKSGETDELDPETKQELLEGHWELKKDFLERIRNERFEASQRELQREINLMAEHDVAQKAIDDYRRKNRTDDGRKF